MTAQDALKPPEPYKLKVADYLALDRAGAFEGLRTELIEGEIIVMSPQTRRHMFIKSELAYRLRRALEGIGSSLFVGLEGSVEIAQNSLPEPDILLTSAPIGDGYVPIASLAMVIEVSVTSLELDLKRKRALYARHRIPEYWVVDANARTIHQMWAPAGDDFAEQCATAFGERVAAATIGGLEADTSGLA